MQRATSSYSARNDRYAETGARKQKYGQYAQLYFARLKEQAQALEPLVQARWGMPVLDLQRLEEGKRTACIGTLYKVSLFIGQAIFPLQTASERAPKRRAASMGFQTAGCSAFGFFCCSLCPSHIAHHICGVQIG